MKSEIVAKLAKKLGLPLIDIKLSDAKFSDFLGLPVDVSPVSAKTGE